MTKKRFLTAIASLVAIFPVLGCEDEPSAPMTGTFTINPEPNSISAPWHLTGPGGYEQSGVGDMTMANMSTGNYTLTWGAVPGWNLPNPSMIMQTLAANGALIFTGTYTVAVRSVTIDPNPNEIAFPWHLSGPNGFSRVGTGDLTIADLLPGNYTLTWIDVDGWRTPNPATVTEYLALYSSVAFTGTYLPLTGTIEVDSEPNGIEAPWLLTGPNSYSLLGTQDMTLLNMAEGNYTLHWGIVSGWARPGPLAVTRTLSPGSTLTFSGLYTSNPGVPDGFMLIHAGTFLMGSPASEVGRTIYEAQHQVTLTHDFYAHATEVTIQQYCDALQWAYDNGYVEVANGSIRDNLDGSNEIRMIPSEMAFSAGTFSCSNPTHPVTFVTWYDAAAYCDWLSLQQSLPRAYNHITWLCNSGNPYTATGYRLPTEAEWEYACRAGTQTPFNTGSCLGTGANYNGAYPYAGCSPVSAGFLTLPVGSHPANSFGLFDMHGNVYEWCNDWWGGYDVAATNPAGAAVGYFRVIRGGYWYDKAQDCRSAFRNTFGSSGSHHGVGFRPVRSAN